MKKKVTNNKNLILTIVVIIVAFISIIALPILAVKAINHRTMIQTSKNTAEAKQRLHLKFTPIEAIYTDRRVRGSGSFPIPDQDPLFDQIAIVKLSSEDYKNIQDIAKQPVSKGLVIQKEPTINWLKNTTLNYSEDTDNVRITGTTYNYNLISNKKYEDASFIMLPDNYIFIYIFPF